MEEVDINSTIIEWTSIVFLEASSHSVAPSPATAHQWKNALVFIHERLKSNGAANPGEAWLLQHEQVVLSSIINDYRSIVDAAVAFLTLHPLKYFFNGMLCFASHCAKHAVCLNMSATEYLRKAAELFRRTPFIENRCEVYKHQGWTAYVIHENGTSYIKTLHLKASWHAQYLQNL